MDFWPNDTLHHAVSQVSCAPAGELAELAPGRRRGPERARLPPLPPTIATLIGPDGAPRPRCGPRLR